jgi:hypothetical protein
VDAVRESSLDRCMASAILALRADGDGSWSNVRELSLARSSAVCVMLEADE